MGRALNVESRIRDYIKTQKIKYHMKFVIGLFINSKALPNAVWRIAINILVHLGRLLQRRLKCQCIPSQLNCAKAPFRDF